MMTLRAILKRFVWSGSLVFLAGCQVFAAPDEVATLQAENSGIIQEATAIARSANRDRDTVAATADAASTQAAQIHQANLVLLATVRAGDAPQQRVVVSTEGQVPDLAPGQSWFVKTGVSASINTTNGCVVAPQIRFASDVPVIYATLRVYNAEAGLTITATWEYEGTEVYRDSVVLSRGAAETCVWFSISPAEVDLRPGNWAARLFAKGAQLESPIAFSIFDSANS